MEKQNAEQRDRKSTNGTWDSRQTRPRKWDLQASEVYVRECTDQVQFSSDLQSFVDAALLFSRLHHFYSLSPPLLLSLCFSLLSHLFCSTPHPFSPRLFSQSTTFRPCLPHWLHFRGQIPPNKSCNQRLGSQWIGACTGGSFRRRLFKKFLIFSNIFLIFYFRYFCVCEC